MVGIVEHEANETGAGQSHSVFVTVRVCECAHFSGHHGNVAEVIGNQRHHAIAHEMTGHFASERDGAEVAVGVEERNLGVCIAQLPGAQRAAENINRPAEFGRGT